MPNKRKRRYFAVVSLLLAIISLMTSCMTGYTEDPDISSNQELPERDLMKNISPSPVPEKLPDEDFYTMVNDFTSRLFIEMYQTGENIAVSPVSVLQSLLLTANAAEGKSRDEIINSVNRYMELDDLNAYMATYANNLMVEHDAEMAVSVWSYRYSENITPVTSFLQLSVDYYLGKAYLLELAEDYTQLVTEWMTGYAGLKNTDGLDIVPPSDGKSVSIIGMLTGNFKWTEPFSETVSGTFQSGDQTYETDYMVSYENAAISYSYASGILKELENGMSMALLKPEHGFSLETVILHLSAGRITRILESVSYEEEMKVSVPSFSFTGSPDIVSALRNCGVKTVFDNINSDISNMFGGGRMYIGNISSPVKLDFGAGGVSLDGSDTEIELSESETVEGDYTEMVFDTPFMYILFDGNGCPVLIGKVELPDSAVSASGSENEATDIM